MKAMVGNTKRDDTFGQAMDIVGNLVFFGGECSFAEEEEGIRRKYYLAIDKTNRYQLVTTSGVKAYKYVLSFYKLEEMAEWISAEESSVTEDDLKKVLGQSVIDGL